MQYLEEVTSASPNGEGYEYVMTSIATGSAG